MLLTRREASVIRLSLRGRGHKWVARELGISPKTVEHTLARARRRWGARTTPHLVFMILCAAKRVP